MQVIAKVECIGKHAAVREFGIDEQCIRCGRAEKSEIANMSGKWHGLVREINWKSGYFNSVDYLCLQFRCNFKQNR